MGDHWFDDKGETGDVTLSWNGDDWIVTDPEPDTVVVCSPGSDVTMSEVTSTYRVRGTVSWRTYGNDGTPGRLYLTDSELLGPAAVESSSEQRESRESSAESAVEANDGDDEETPDTSVRGLVHLTGSGDYVTVEGVVNNVHHVDKESSNMPDVIGGLIDDTVKEEVPFVVDHGVSHPYLEEGKRFRFEGVKDHLYRRDNEVQVKITRYTTFVDEG